jgi:serine/threonine protein kinase
VLASLNHPNIAQLFDAGWSEAGRPYLALEYVDGEPLLAWCQAHRLDTAARLRQFVAVVRAVAHAHAHLVVHRDLKPSNVLVTAEGQVKLLDFGIAKLLDAGLASAEETELTRLGGRALTPGYAAPEQILGQPITTATDIYALGVMLFELLTGERPYRLARTDAQSRSALEEAIIRVDAMAPSAAAKEKAVRRALRGDLDAIVLKALRKRPEERYQTAAEFAEDIERHLDHRPVQAQRDNRAYRLRRFVVRNRVALTAVSAVLVALVAAWRRRLAGASGTKKPTLTITVRAVDPSKRTHTRAKRLARPIWSCLVRPNNASHVNSPLGRICSWRSDWQLQRRIAIGATGSERARRCARPWTRPGALWRPIASTCSRHGSGWPNGRSSIAPRTARTRCRDRRSGVLGKPAIPA